MGFYSINWDRLEGLVGNPPNRISALLTTFLRAQTTLLRVYDSEIGDYSTGPSVYNLRRYIVQPLDDINALLSIAAVWDAGIEDFSLSRVVELALLANWLDFPVEYVPRFASSDNTAASFDAMLSSTSGRRPRACPSLNPLRPNTAHWHERFPIYADFSSMFTHWPPGIAWIFQRGLLAHNYNFADILTGCTRSSNLDAWLGVGLAGFYNLSLLLTALSHYFGRGNRSFGAQWFYWLRDRLATTPFDFYSFSLPRHLYEKGDKAEAFCHDLRRLGGEYAQAAVA